MTQRARLAILRFWLSQQRFSWRRRARFFVLALSLALAASPSLFAEESSWTSKEASPAVPKAITAKTQVKKAASSVLQEMEAPKGKKFELPDVDPKDEKAEGTNKTLKGSVSAKSLYGLAVMYGVDPVKGELEMWSEFNRSTKLSGYKNFAAIGDGDKVEIKYKELKKTKKKILQEVRFVAKKPKEEPVAEDAVPSAKPASKPVSALSAVKL